MTTKVDKHLLYLASTSSARADLLRERGYEFSILSNGGESDARHYDDPHAYTIERALAKARSASLKVSKGVIIGADTVAFCCDSIIGKPASVEDAVKVLYRLSRTNHEVITGIALVALPSGLTICATDSTLVTMRPMTVDEIDSYVQSGEAMGKAGSYAVQQTGDRFVERMEGSYSNVVGLPMELLVELLAILANRGIVVK